MKKIILTLSFATLLLTSCSGSDDAPTPTSGGTMPSKIVTTFSTGQISTSTFTYSGNKIIEENIVPSSDFSKVKYTYTGDNITKIEIFSGSNFSPAGGFNLTYENGKQKTSTEIAQAGYNGDLRKETFAYNADGTVTRTSSGINQTTGVESANGRQMKFTYTADLLTKTESISAGVAGQVTNYTNDETKNQAFKNVIGYGIIEERGNLRLSENYVGNPLSNRTYVYNYNSSNFPAQVAMTASGTQSNTRAFTY